MGVKRTNHFELSSRWSSRVSWRFMERWSNSYLILELQSHFGRAGLSPKWQPFISPHDKQRFFPTWEPETLNLDGLDWGDGKAKILCRDKTYIYRLRVFCVKSCQVAPLAVRQQITWSAWIRNHLQSPPLPNADAQHGQHKLQSETVWQTPTYGSCSNSNDLIPTISNCQEMMSFSSTVTALRYWGQLRKPTSVLVGWCRFGSPKYIVVQISLMPGFTDTLSIILHFWIMKHLNTQVHQTV